MHCDLTDGYELEEPPVTVPWGLSRRQLIKLLEPHGLKQVDGDNFVISCVSLCGLSHTLSIHFDTRCRARRYYLRLSQSPSDDFHSSYELFQQHLERKFGSSSTYGNTEDNIVCHKWNIGEFTVHHAGFERFVLHETVSISPPMPELSIHSRALHYAQYIWTCNGFLLPRLLLFWLVSLLLVNFLLCR